MGNLPERLRGLDPRTWDYVVVGIALAICIPEGIVYSDGEPARLIISSGAVGATLSLLRRRRQPLLPAALISLYFVASGAIEPDVYDALTAPFLALMVALFSLGRHASDRVAAIGFVMAVVGSTLGAILSGSFDSPAQLLWLMILGCGPLLAGRTMRRRTEMQAELLERNRELERDREQVAQRAVGDERARIAGELQAVVANGVSAMVVQAEGIPRVLAAGDPGRAEHAFALIEETGRDALVEMRRLLGVLRRDDESPSLAPLPTLADVERLSSQIRGDGLVVTIDVDGERVPLPPGADLAAYRVLEEALDAAAAAGAGIAEVTVGFRVSELQIDVRDDRADAGVDPAPLLTMRERLGLYGGRVRAGAEGEEGHRVVARLPLSEVPA